jgi:hypothetical protein
MRDYLLDIVQHTHGLGVINMIKITGTAESTTVNAFDQATKTVILDAEFKVPLADFVGVFGMPNLDRLNTILNIPEYKDGAKITVSKRVDGDVTSLSGIDFENKTGDFKNNYRFMSTAVINDQLKNVKMKPVKWGVEIVPTAASIQKLKFQSQAHSDATAFSTKTEDGNLKFYFGDVASHAGSFVFSDHCGGSLSKQLFWPLNVVNSIFSLPGDKTFKISDEGVAEITVDSGLAVYQYKLPAQSK